MLTSFRNKPKKNPNPQKYRAVHADSENPNSWFCEDNGGLVLGWRQTYLVWRGLVIIGLL